MTRPGARQHSEAKELTQRQIIRETLRQKFEFENRELPLFKLPPELRNAIYQLALPNNETLNANGTMKETVDGIKPCAGNRHPTFGQFSITQVCRQLRAKTIQITYGSNVFKVIVEAPEASEPGSEPDWLWFCHGSADAWVKSRPAEALPSISRVVLVWYPTPDKFLYRRQFGVETAFFDLKAGTIEVLPVKKKKKYCTCGVPTEYRQLLGVKMCRACQRTLRKMSYDDVLEAIRGVGSKEKPAEKLLKLIQAFRESFQTIE